MSASMKMNVFGKSGLLRDLNAFSRRNTQRILHKRLSQVKPSPIPYTGNLEDKQGNAIRPKPGPFPRELDIDHQIEAECEEKGRRYLEQHAGTMHIRTPDLPELLENNARLLIAKDSLLNSKKLLEDAKHLSEIYKRRQPVLESKEIKDRLESIILKQYAVHVEKNKVKLEELTEKQTEEMKQTVLRQSKAIFIKTTHNWKPIKYSDYYGMVYLAARLAPNYRVLLQIFYEMHRRDPEFVPGSIYNLGSGVGSVIWAANTIWKKNVFEYYCVDSSKYMNDLCRKLQANDIEDPLSSIIPGVHFRQFSPSADKNQFHMVVSAYTLMEQPSRSVRLELVATLWKQTQHYLVLVEHGTSAGYRLIIEARDKILKMKEKHPSLEGHVFAPCTHDEVCPKLKFTKYPCTFSVEYKMLNILNANGQGMNASERYSYVVMKKGPRQEGDNYPRITEVSHAHGHSHCKMCCPDGTLRHSIITKVRPSKVLYKLVKKSEMGDFLPVNWPTETGNEMIEHADFTNGASGDAELEQFSDGEEGGGQTSGASGDAELEQFSDREADGSQTSGASGDAELEQFSDGEAGGGQTSGASGDAELEQFSEGEAGVGHDENLDETVSNRIDKHIAGDVERGSDLTR